MKYDNKYYLYATRGDLSEGAMGDKASVIEIKQEDYKLIKYFMDAQNEFNIEVFFSEGVNENRNQTNYVRKFFSACDKMIDAGIFTNKYQCRTTWELWHGSDLEDNKKGKYEIINWVND